MMGKFNITADVCWGSESAGREMMAKSVVVNRGASAGSVGSGSIQNAEKPAVTWKPKVDLVEFGEDEAK
jgi:hypothetical protein